MQPCSEAKSTLWQVKCNYTVGRPLIHNLLYSFSDMFHRPLCCYCIYCAALLVTRTSARKENIANEGTPHIAPLNLSQEILCKWNRKEEGRKEGETKDPYYPSSIRGKGLSDMHIIIWRPQVDTVGSTYKYQLICLVKIDHIRGLNT